MPTLLSNIRKAVETTFKNGWANTTPVRYQNVPWKQPAPPFVALGIQWGVANVTSLGTTKRHEQNGIVVVTITAPLDAGTAPIYALADAAQALFRDKQLTENTTTVNFYESSVGAAGEGPTGYSLNVVCRFKADDLF